MLPTILDFIMHYKQILYTKIASGFFITFRIIRYNEIVGFNLKRILAMFELFKYLDFKNNAFAVRQREKDYSCMTERRHYC